MNWLYITNPQLLSPTEVLSFCHAFESLYSVKHVLVEHPEFLHIKIKFFKISDLHKLWPEIKIRERTRHVKYNLVGLLLRFTYERKIKIKKKSYKLSLMGATRSA